MTFDTFTDRVDVICLLITRQTSLSLIDEVICFFYTLVPSTKCFQTVQKTLQMLEGKKVMIIER